MLSTLPGFGQRVTARRSSAHGEGLIVDLFAGAGGASLGIEAAMGRAVDYAVNHDPLAVEMHAVNHPATEHLRSDVWEVEPVSVTRGRPVRLLWASPDCKHFSKAKGGRPVSKRVRSLAWVVIKWARDAAPDVILLENVEEFQTWGPLGSDERPCPRRKGETFRRWVRQLQNLGYAVEWRELVAADYGVPTTRKRLFLIARRDGAPIVWPEPTHAPRKVAAARGLAPWRAAAECIDFSLPCPSIFTRRRPLAEATMKRIALGLKRYVIENAEPFIIPIDHRQSGDDVARSTDEPLTTVTQKARHAIVTPYLTQFYGSNAGAGGDPADPMKTATAQGNHAGLVAPYLVGAGGPRYSAKPTPLDRPFGTLIGENHKALVSAFLAKHYGGVVGHGLERPVGTVTTKDHHALVVSRLSNNSTSNTNGGRGDPRDPREPMKTQTTATHTAEVRAFLTAFYGNEKDGRDARDPLGTATTKDRFGLVTVAGVDYEIVDIGMRMLTPRELLRAQFGRFADEYVLLGTQAQQVKGIGNSVCPEVAEALVRANLSAAAAPAREEACA